MYDGVQDNRAVLGGERFSERILYIGRLFEANALRAHSFGHPREIRSVEIDAERTQAGFLLLDVDEAQRLIVQDDLNDRRLALNLCKHIAECKHGEAAVAAERDCLPAGKGEWCAESIGSSVGHRAPRKQAKDSALVSTFDVPGVPKPVQAGVHEEHGVGSG